MRVIEGLIHDEREARQKSEKSAYLVAHSMRQVGAGEVPVRFRQWDWVLSTHSFPFAVTPVAVYEGLTDDEETNPISLFIRAESDFPHRAPSQSDIDNLLLWLSEVSEDEGLEPDFKVRLQLESTPKMTVSEAQHMLETDAREIIEQTVGQLDSLNDAVNLAARTLLQEAIKVLRDRVDLGVGLS